MARKHNLMAGRAPNPVYQMALSKTPGCRLFSRFFSSHFGAQAKKQAKNGHKKRTFPYFPPFFSVLSVFRVAFPAKELSNHPVDCKRNLFIVLFG